LLLILEGNPLHELTTSSLTKRKEQQRENLSRALDKTEVVPSKPSKVYTIGLLNDSQGRECSSENSSSVPLPKLLGYIRSVRPLSVVFHQSPTSGCIDYRPKAQCTAIQSLRGYYTEGIDEDDVSFADGKENFDPSADDGDDWERELTNDDQLTFLGIKEHLAVLDYNNYYIHTGRKKERREDSFKITNPFSSFFLSPHERYRDGQGPGARVHHHREGPSAWHLLVPCSRYVRPLEASPPEAPTNTPTFSEDCQGRPSLLHPR